MTDILPNPRMERNYNRPEIKDKDEIRYYEERLSKRRNKDKEELKLNEFLHNSLRTSERLRSLEKSKKQPVSRVNAAFEEDHNAQIDEIADFDVPKMVETVCNRRQVRNAVQRTDLDWLQRHIQSPSFQNQYNTVHTMGKILTKYNYPTIPGHSRALPCSTEVIGQLKKAHKSSSHSSPFKYQILELQQILEDPYLMSLLESNDLCTKVARSNSDKRREDNKQEPLYPGTSLDSPVKQKKAAKQSPKESRSGKSNHKQSSPNVEIKYGRDSGKFIRSPLEGCYAQIYQTESGIPLKTVVLEKGNQPLGATVRNERESVVVGRIVVGGVAHKSGLLREGDELLSVNNIDLTSKDINEVSDILARMKGTLKFTVAAADDGTISTINQHRVTNTIHLRALFTYNPDDDVYIPCRDIGLRFDRGNIMHVTNTYDPNWWQAYRDDDNGHGNGALGDLAGLIPSPDYQYNRENLRKKLGLDEPELDMYNNQESDSSILCVKKNKKQPATVNGWVYNVDSQRVSVYDQQNKRKNRKAKRSTYYPGDLENNFHDPTINTYEEVELFLPQPHRKRPIVLVGPELIGRHEIVRLIVESDASTFALVKQHTTLTNPSKDYISITKEAFKHMQNQEDFIETGVFEKNLYGTSKWEVKSIIDSGKMAVLVLQPESLHLIRKTSFLPYIIFVSPPQRINDLRKLRMTLDETRPADQELHNTINRAKAIDLRFGHLFDSVLEVISIESALEIALNTINRLERDPQWVPSGWLSQRPKSMT